MQSATSIQFISDSTKNTFNHSGKSTVLTVNATQCCLTLKYAAHVVHPSQRWPTYP